MIVDASVVVEYLSRGTGAEDARRAMEPGGLAAPHLLDAEVGHALRAHVRSGLLDAGDAVVAIHDLADMGIERVGHGGLLRRAWALRDNLSFYDGLYVALAETLDTPIVTFDARLAAAPGHEAEVVLLSG